MGTAPNIVRASEQAKLKCMTGREAGTRWLDIGSLLALCSSAPAQRQDAFCRPIGAKAGDALRANTFHTHGDIPQRRSGRAIFLRHDCGEAVKDRRYGDARCWPGNGHSLKRTWAHSALFMSQLNRKTHETHSFGLGHDFHLGLGGLRAPSRSCRARSTRCGAWPSWPSRCYWCHGWPRCDGYHR